MCNQRNSAQLLGVFFDPLRNSQVAGVLRYWLRSKPVFHEG